MLETSKESKKPAKLKPWERKSPWVDASDHQKERWQSEDILSLNETDYPRLTLAKNKARFFRMLTWYKGKRKMVRGSSFKCDPKSFEAPKKGAR